MTRLAFCFISNDPSEFYRLDESFNFKCSDIVNSFTKNVVFNPPISPSANRWGDWNVIWKSYNSGEYTDYFSIRQDSLTMASNSEFIFVGDDDFIFKIGSEEVINECIQYMTNHVDCGAIYLAANFGDAYKYHNNEIYIINNGHLGTNRGIMLRNRKELMDNRLHSIGANEDFVIGFTCLLQGYYLCRRLHMPIEHNAQNNRIGVSKNSDIEFLMNKGIMSKVNKYIGKWTNHNVWPENIFEYYYQNASRKGANPKYTVHGEIRGG